LHDGRQIGLIGATHYVALASHMVHSACIL
jgi:hypothetical protein